MAEPPSPRALRVLAPRLRFSQLHCAAITADTKSTWVGVWEKKKAKFNY